jgi:hypothetical protein
MSDNAKKLAALLAALVLAFAAGRYTMRSATKQEVEKEYELRYSEKLTKLELSLKEEFNKTTEFIRKSVEEASTKIATIEEKITVKPDGTHIIERKKSSKEIAKKKTSTQKDKTASNGNKEEKKTETSKDTVKEEKSKEIVKTIPPKSWRVYGAYALDNVGAGSYTQYGAGAMYDLGPVNVGGFSLYQPDDATVNVGFTMGVSF